MPTVNQQTQSRVHSVHLAPLSRNNQSCVYSLTLSTTVVSIQQKLYFVDTVILVTTKGGKSIL